MSSKSAKQPKGCINQNNFIMNIIKTFAFAMVGFYLLFSFISMDWNLVEWHPIGRVFMLILSGFTTFVIEGIYRESKQK
jgi:hypothetical protein